MLLFYRTRIQNKTIDIQAIDIEQLSSTIDNNNTYITSLSRVVDESYDFLNGIKRTDILIYGSKEVERVAKFIEGLKSDLDLFRNA